MSTLKMLAEQRKKELDEFEEKYPHVMALIVELKEYIEDLQAQIDETNAAVADIQT